MSALPRTDILVERSQIFPLTLLRLHRLDVLHRAQTLTRATPLKEG